MEDVTDFPKIVSSPTLNKFVSLVSLATLYKTEYVTLLYLSATHTCLMVFVVSASAVTICQQMALAPQCHKAVLKSSKTTIKDAPHVLSAMFCKEAFVTKNTPTALYMTKTQDNVVNAVKIITS